jgi:hypothetical protein
LEFLGVLIIGLGEFVMGGQEHDLQGEGRHDLCFVNKMMSQLKVAAFADIGVTCNFISEWNPIGIHYKVEHNKASFEVVNSAVKANKSRLFYTFEGLGMVWCFGPPKAYIV